MVQTPTIEHFPEAMSLHTVSVYGTSMFWSNECSNCTILNMRNPLGMVLKSDLKYLRGLDDPILRGFMVPLLRIIIGIIM